MASPRRFRGLGKGRTTRRALEHGGLGLAARLNRALGAWDGVRITPMFGRWGYFARRGWIELDLTDDTDVPRALRWLRRAHAADLPAGEPD
jgi:hypothetical protein